MSDYKNALSRLGILAVLITGMMVMAKPAAAETCVQQCMSNFNTCIADCPPREIGCNLFCNIALRDCEEACSN